MKEKIALPEVKKDELLELIERIDYRDGEKFIFNGSRYLLLLMNQEDIDSGDTHESVFYTSSTADRGSWDIYILETLTGDERRRSLFHEILECNLADQGFEHPFRHQIALKAEEEMFGQRESSEEAA